MIIKCAKKIRGLSLLPIGQGRSFCSGNNQMKFLRDRAYLASSIIKRIKSKNNIDDLKHLSLSESIIKYLQTVKDVEDKARSELLDHFKYGTQYDSEILTQTRIQLGKMEGQEKLKFYPTKFVTSQLFRKFLDDKYQFPKKRIMYAGSFGISKSFSSILYSRLSNMVAEYNFKNPTKDYLDMNSGIINSPKVLYYNFIQQDLQDWGLRQRIIKQLSSQINRQNLDNYLNSKKFMEDKNKNAHNQKIKTAYNNRGIQVVLFIDQISEYFSLLRKKQEGNVADSADMKLMILRFQQQIKSFDGQLNSIVYFSSMDIESDLIASSGLNSQNSPLQQQKIPYAERLYQDEYMSQIIDIFLFCFKQKFKIKNLQESSDISVNNRKKSSIIMKLKKKLFNYLYQRRLDYFLSFLYIRQGISDKFKQQLLQCDYDLSRIYNKYNAYNSQALQNLIFQMFKVILQSSRSKLKTAFTDFLTKRNLNKDFFDPLILQLYFAAYIAQRAGTNFYTYKINVRSYNQSKEPQKNLQRSIYKQIFSIKNNQVQCMVPPAIVIEMLSTQIGSALTNVMKNKIELLIQKMNHSVLGGCAEHFFIKAITAGNKKLILSDKSLRNQTIIYNITSNWYRFKQINPPRRKVNLQNEENNDKTQRSLNLTSVSNTDLSKNTLNRINLINEKQKYEEIQFLSSFKQGITQQFKKLQQQRTQRSRSVVFLPRHKQYVTNQSVIDKINFVLKEKHQKITKYQKQILDKGKQLLVSAKYSFNTEVSHTSKAIDFIIVDFQTLKKNQKLLIYAFDMTISENQVTSKINKFLSSFKTFSDRNKNKITVGDNQLTVEMGYYVICPRKNTNAIDENYFNQKFGDKFIFKNQMRPTATSRSILEIKSKENQNQCILKQIGTYDIYHEVEVMNQNQNNKQDETVKIWNYFKQQLFETTQERKQNKKLIKTLLKVLSELMGPDEVLNKLEQDENNEDFNQK